jgi:hypothetical protein
MFASLMQPTALSLWVGNVMIARTFSTQRLPLLCRTDSVRPTVFLAVDLTLSGVGWISIGLGLKPRP